MPAEDALAYGLINEVVEPEPSLEAALARPGAPLAVAWAIGCESME